MITPLESLLVEGAVLPKPWLGYALVENECLSYALGNAETQEWIVVDPTETALPHLEKLGRDQPKARWCAVIDTHTHADHVSSASTVAERLGTPLIQHFKSSSSRVNLRVSRDTKIPLAAGALTLLETPGHTPDGLTIFWGPFLVSGDTVLYGDTGRDDLPGGDPEAHWQSLQKIKQDARPEMLVLPGHDPKGGRLSSWAHQLKNSPSLSQEHTAFVREAAAFAAPAPKLLKESLFANLK